ncbi:MAG: hypothetical protein JWM36_3416 [Hyphomicrobiales bacterium]|nr:hypothetical protein [Hyphomicrobiales bacterium]
MVSNRLKRPEPPDGGVKWLSSTAIRQRRSRLPALVALVAPLVVIASLTVLIVDFTPRATATPPLLSSSKPADSTPPPRSAEYEPPRLPETPAVRTILPSPVAPAARSPSPPEPAMVTPDPPAVASSIPEDAAPAAVAPVEQKPVNLAGAFPTQTPASTTGEPGADGAEYAIYFDEAAPGEPEARSLLGEVQKKYAGQLAGGRLTYRRVRVGDGYMFRVRMSGLSQSRAAEICESLKASGAGCEVGPR